jgi:hypothetical protein
MNKSINKITIISNKIIIIIITTIIIIIMSHNKENTRLSSREGTEKISGKKSW